MSRFPVPEVDLPRPQPLAGVDKPGPRALAAGLTAFAAVAAMGLVAGPAAAVPFAGPCALERTAAHHSEGLDTWNPAYPKPKKTLNAVMVFLSFPDSLPLTTPDELASDYFPSTSRFFDRASYGKFSLVPHPQRQWVQMPHASTAYAIQRDWDAAHRSAYLQDALKAADPYTDFSKYDVVYFVADPDAPGVDSDATKVVNFDQPMRADGTDIRRIVTVFERHPPDRNVLAHETGHVFDLPDLYHRPTDGKGDWDTYVGDWDVMGSQFGLSPDLFGWHKWKLGWLDQRQVTCVKRSGETRLTLEPLSTGPRGRVLRSVRVVAPSSPSFVRASTAPSPWRCEVAPAMMRRPVAGEFSSTAYAAIPRPGAAPWRSSTRTPARRPATANPSTRRWPTPRWGWAKPSRCRATTTSASRRRTGRRRGRGR